MENKKLLSSKFYQNFFTRHRTKFCLVTGVNFGSNNCWVKLCKGEQAIGNREQKRENRQESEQLGFKSFLLPVARSLFPPRRGCKASSSPSELGGVKGKGEGGKVLNPLTFTLSPFPRPHLASLGWQTTSSRGEQC